MKRFKYHAKTKEGEDRKGRIDARDISGAVNVLREKGWVVVRVDPLQDSGGMVALSKFFQKVKLNDVVMFTRQLSTMVASGLPLIEALNVLELQSKPAMARVIGEMLQDIQGGMAIADALGKHKRVFSPVYISLVRAGEAAGVLDDVLKRLATNLEKEKDFKGKTKGALVYPGIVMGGMGLVALVMMVFVVPKLTAMYEDFGADLPLPTKILMGMSEFTTKFWYVLAAAGGVGVFFFKTWVKTDVGRYTFDGIMLKMPIMGKLKINIILTEMARTMGLLIGAGISLVEALEIISDAIDSVVYQESVGNIIEEVKKGIPFSVAVTRERIFPPIFGNMAAVGEETGKMDEVLLKVANYFEEESEQTIKNLTTALEPLIMIVLGLGVGFLVVAIIMPIYGLSNQF